MSNNLVLFTVIFASFFGIMLTAWLYWKYKKLSSQNKKLRYQMSEELLLVGADAKKLNYSNLYRHFCILKDDGMDRYIFTTRASNAIAYHLNKLQSFDDFAKYMQSFSQAFEHTKLDEGEKRIVVLVHEFVVPMVQSRFINLAQTKYHRIRTMPAVDITKSEQLLRFKQQLKEPWATYFKPTPSYEFFEEREKRKLIDGKQRKKNAAPVVPIETETKTG